MFAAIAKPTIVYHRRPTPIDLYLLATAAYLQSVCGVKNPVYWGLLPAKV